MQRLASTALIVPVSLLLTIAGVLAGALPASAAGADPEPGPVSILINELANGGPGSDADGFIELRNWGSETVDLGGWNLYRCSATGLRSNTGASEADFRGITLAPGAVAVVSKGGMPGDVHTMQAYARTGFGAYLEAPDDRVADRVGVYPNSPWPTQSECTAGANVPNRLDFSQDESWQRVSDTGDPSRDLVVAHSTLGGPNATEPSARATTTVVISEFAAEGPDGDADDLVELQNTGRAAVDISGWSLYRCTATGRARADTRQLVVAAGTVIDPGGRWLAVGPDFEGPADARYPTSFADAGSGAIVRDADGLLVDRIAVTDYVDSACQDGSEKLPAILDPATGESYQRAADGDFVIAPRTPGRANATVDAALAREPFSYPQTPGVAISELATDPGTDGMPSGWQQRNYVELANYGDSAVDIGGWTLRRCQADGVRARDLQATVPRGTTLRPGETWLAAREGTAAATRADAVYAVSFDFLGSGIWVADRDGDRVDSVGVFARNELDARHDVTSPCTKGLALSTYQPDRLLQQTFQRTGFTGVDVDDFGVAAATPGRFESPRAVIRASDSLTYTAPPSVLGEQSQAGAARDADTVPATATGSITTTAGIGAGTGAGTAADTAAGIGAGTAADHAGRSARPAASVAVSPKAGTAAPLVVLEAYAGASENGPLVDRSRPGETQLDPAALAPAFDDRWAYPYQRLVIDAAALGAGSTVSWSGTTTGRNELQPAVWNPRLSTWRQVDASAVATGDSAPGIRLSARLIAGDIVDGRVELLIQSGPRTEPTLAPGIDGMLQDPADYDLAISYITDTQYLSESYPQVYDQLTGWIADNADDRKIAFATHTGDIVQNWVDPDQPQQRVLREFDRASAAQSILDDAGVPNSVLPGNHDSKRGVDYSLFNEYFPPSRYADQPWYGGSIAPGDNTANFSIVESSGARFLMLSLPYAYGEREIAWAEQVVTAHPDANVVISTHEHVSPKTLTDTAQRSTASRWVSRAGILWDRVIAPNRNVIAVLSGPFHGLGQVVTEDAGGIPGHDVVELLADYQEFRTHTGERATGFQRLLQVDLASNTIAVDTFSTRLAATSSADYDYPQFLPDNGRSSSLSNDRPWNIVAAGVQNRYTEADDDFAAHVSLQYEKSVSTSGVSGSR